MSDNAPVSRMAASTPMASARVGVVSANTDTAVLAEDVSLPAWSVKGVDRSTRELAKLAAARAGLSLGEWFNRLILLPMEAREANSPPTESSPPDVADAEAADDLVNIFMNLTQAQKTERRFRFSSPAAENNGAVPPQPSVSVRTPTPAAPMAATYSVEMPAPAPMSYTVSAAASLAPVISRRDVIRRAEIELSQHAGTDADSNTTLYLVIFSVAVLTAAWVIYLVYRFGL